MKNNKVKFMCIAGVLTALVYVVTAYLHIPTNNGYIHIASIIDNLVKGASGQAVENMNMIFGLEQTTGLRFKPNAF